MKITTIPIHALKRILGNDSRPTAASTVLVPRYAFENGEVRRNVSNRFPGARIVHAPWGSQLAVLNGSAETQVSAARENTCPCYLAPPDSLTVFERARQLQRGRISVWRLFGNPG